MDGSTFGKWTGAGDANRFINLKISDNVSGDRPGGCSCAILGGASVSSGFCRGESWKYSRRRDFCGGEQQEEGKPFCKSPHKVNLGEKPRSNNHLSGLISSREAMRRKTGMRRVL